MRRVFAFLIPLVLTACAGGAQAPEWQLNAAQAMQRFEHDYLVGDSGGAARDFGEVLSNLRRTGREDLLARAELARCAVRTASLEFDDCPGFEALRSGATATELAYADYLAGRGEHRAAEEPLSRLVAAAVSLKQGKLTPSEIGAAVDTASAQGWSRPLLAWLGVQAKRAQAAGDSETAARLKRRMDLISR